MANIIYSTVKQGGLACEGRLKFWEKFSDPSSTQSEINAERRRVEQREIESKRV